MSHEALVLRPLPDQRGLEVSWNLTLSWAPQARHYCRRVGGNGAASGADGTASTAWRGGTGTAAGPAGASATAEDAVDAAGRLCHSEGFPAEVADLLHESAALDLSLSLTSGQWDGRRWGVSPFHRSHGPDGGAVSASFPGTRVSHAAAATNATSAGGEEDGQRRDALVGRAQQRAMAVQMRRWAALRRGLGELVNVPMDAAIPFAPHFDTAATTGPIGVEATHTDTPEVQFRALLPREKPGVDNLTPVLSLTPCGGHAGRVGLVALLSPPTFFSGDYYAITLAASRRSCLVDEPAGRPCTLSLQISMTTVLRNVLQSETGGVSDGGDNGGREGSGEGRRVVMSLGALTGSGQASPPEPEGFETKPASLFLEDRPLTRAEAPPGSDDLEGAFAPCPLCDSSRIITAALPIAGGLQRARLDATEATEGLTKFEGLEDSTSVVLHSRVLTHIASKFRSAHGDALAQVGGSGSVIDIDPWRWASWPVGAPSSSPGEGDAPREGEGKGEGECEQAADRAEDYDKGHSIGPQRGPLAVRRQFLAEAGGTGFTGKLQVTLDVVSCKMEALDKEPDGASLHHAHPPPAPPTPPSLSQSDLSAPPAVVRYSDLIPDFITPMLHTASATIIAPDGVAAHLRIVPKVQNSEQMQLQGSESMTPSASTALLGWLHQGLGYEAQPTWSPFVTDSDGRSGDLASWATNLNSVLEVTAVVPRGGRLLLTLDVKVGIVEWERWPPDVSRGFEWPPASAELLELTASNGTATSRHTTPVEGNGLVSYTAYSAGTLVDVPVPDFSMPFNVITINSTLAAFLIGTVLNQLVRKKRKRPVTTRTKTKGS